MTKEIVKGTKRILCFGDSLTEGWYQDGAKFHPYTISLSAKINQDEKLQGKFEVVNKGLSCECVIDEMTKRMPKVLQEVQNLCLAVILGGTNDLISLPRCRSRNLPSQIATLHYEAHKLEIQTCALTLPDADVGYLPMTKDYVDYREQVNEAIRLFAKENSDHVILCDIAYLHPMLTLAKGVREKLWDDDLHCTPAGYDRMGGIIFDAIRPFLLTLV